MGFMAAYLSPFKIGQENGIVDEFNNSGLEGLFSRFVSNRKRSALSRRNWLASVARGLGNDRLKRSIISAKPLLNQLCNRPGVSPAQWFTPLPYLD